MWNTTHDRTKSPTVARQDNTTEVRTTSTPKYDWWPYVKGMIRRYPGLAEDYNALHQQGTTPSYSGMPGGGGEGRPLEDIAARTLPGVHQQEYDAVTAAIAKTRSLPNGAARLEVIKYVFWEGNRGRRLLSQAADRVHYSYDAVKEFHREFIRLVASNFGLLGDHGTYTQESQKDVVK